MKPYYSAGGITIYHGDWRDESIQWPRTPGCVIFDPPWDAEMEAENLWGSGLPEAASLLAFTDARRFRDTVLLFGAPTWVFVWNTMSSWQCGPRRPLQQTKYCLWYGDINSYRRDAVLHGDPPAPKNHPSTISVPASGRRLSDLWTESLRWLHHPSARSGSAGVERFSSRQGNPVLRHAKPLGWVKCLIGNTSSGLVFDPFFGSGTALVAAKHLGREAIGIDISESCCEYAAKWLDREEALR